MNLLQMSYAGAVLILAIALVRLAALRAVPKRTFLILWALVLARLLIPFPGLLRLPSLLPASALTPAAATAAPAPTAGSVPRPAETAAPAGSALPTPQSAGTPAITPAPATAAPALTAAPVMPALPAETAAPEAPASSPGLDVAPRIALWGWIWIPGSCLTTAVFAFLYGVSFQRFRRSVPVTGPEAEAWLSAHPMKRRLRLRTLAGLTSPLTYGILRPVILLPEGQDWDSGETAFALEHEYVHARRLDPLWKLLPILALAVHWFNPFVWLMWFLANRDLELSCDEEVLRRLGAERRGDYARALLAMEEKRSFLPPLHAGFGAGTTRERILSIMKYRKKTILSVALAAALVLALAACALGGRADRDPQPPMLDRGAPGADLTVGPVRWGMSMDDALMMLANTKGDGDAVGHDGKITLAGEFCACPAEISWCFADDGNGLFLNGIEVLFTDADAFDRETVAGALEETWGVRCKYERARKYSPGVDGPGIAPREDWYWRTEDFSDEYEWKSGVTARFTTSEAVYTLRNYLERTGPEPAGAPLLRIDATGRNQAEGRLTGLPRTEETRWEVQRLLGLATLLSPSAASWEYYDPKSMRSYTGDEPASVRIHTPDDLALAEKLFAPYASWLTLDYRGDQYRETDVSGIVQDGSLTPSADIFSREDIYGVSAVFTNRTDGDLTLFPPMNVLAERDGTWVQPEWFHESMPDWDSPTLAPGESRTLTAAYAACHSCYDFVPGRYMLTVRTQGGETGDLLNGVVYGAVIEIADGPAPEAGERFVSFGSGGYTLRVPAQYAEALTVETEVAADAWEVLFSAVETASYEAGQKLSPGNGDGLGWLFSIARVSEDELGKLMMWDMSGIDAFAREQSGDYLLLLRPTDVRFVPNGEDDEGRMARWEAMQDWVRASMPERFLEDNAGLTPCRHGGSFVENALARVLYYDPAEYGEADRPLIRYGDGEGVDALGTSRAREDARRILWEYSMEGAVAAKDFPETGASVTLTDPLGIVVTFREDSDVVRVTYNGDTHQYFRLKSLLLHGNPIGTMACMWYFDAAATLSGETASYRNGDFTLRLPGEYAPQLLVETPEGGEVLFRVSEKASRQRWESRSDHPSGETDGWLFSILRVERESWARSVTGGSSGKFVFAEDSEGCCYVCSYPIWLTFQPEEGATVDRESEAYRQFRTVQTALSSFDAEQHFISDNSLTARYFTDVQQYFLCFAIYGYDSSDTCAIRQGRDGEAFDPRRDETSLWYLKQLLWDMDYSEVGSAQEPEGEPVVLEIGFGRLLFWEDSSLVLLESGESARYFRGSHRGIVYGAYPIGHTAAQCLEAARIAAALPGTSGRTTDYSNQGVSLSIPAEFGDVLYIETPESGESLFRVCHRYSWENGQKLYPGEDWGAGFLFSVICLDEDQLLRDLLVYPPQTMAGRDREGNYYLIAESPDVRFVTEDGIQEYASDPHWREYMALVQWTGQAAELFRASNPDTLIPLEKAFCELEIILADMLYRESAEETDIRLVTPEFFRFVSPEGTVTEASDIPDKLDYARRILLEGSSRWLPADTPEPSGRPIRLEISVNGGSSRLLYTFWPGSELFKEEVFYEANGAHSSRMLRMTLPEGETVGDLMARWYAAAGR